MQIHLDEENYRFMLENEQDKVNNETNSDSGEETQKESTKKIEVEEQAETISEKPTMEKEKPVIEKEESATETKEETTDKKEEKSISKKKETESKGQSKPESKKADSEVVEKQSSETEKDKKTESEKTAQEVADSESVVSSDEEEDDEEVEDEYRGILVKDYDEMNLDALGEELDRLMKAHEVKDIRQHVRDIKAEFDLKFGKEREEKKQAFLAEGGSIIDFSYSTEAEKKFNKLYFEYKEKRDNYYKNIRKNLQENLERRLAIIEELKSITGVGTDMSANFRAFKKLQDRWRKAGPVPRNDYKNTWNTYHHHVERFYNFLHLDREFREMDYKHNLEQKLKMIARAEELIEEKNVNRAFRELQNLHRMWKEEVGPVSQEYSDAIWERFSAATRKIHENRRAHFKELDKQREKNLEVKRDIISKIEELTKENIKSHGQAQQKIKKSQKLREEFFKAGRVPRKDNQPTWDAFKTALRSFNHKKNEFYRKRKEKYKENLEKKMELIRIAEEHKDSEDFETVTPLMKKIQADWKKIGFVQRSKSDKIWKRFKKACNHYFDRLHALRDEKDKELMEAFDKKKALLKEVNQLNLTQNREEDLPKIKEKIEEWKEIGNVPNNKRFIEGKFNKALDKLFKKLDLNRKDAEMLKYENHLESLKDEDDDYKIRKEASFLRKKIDQTATEIRQLETNLQRFDNPERSNPLMKGTFKNIDRLKQQLKIWETKLEKIKSL
ncbi:MAG TPA: DUF349 domain-containing protein [Flavobacteriaceae bacterium]|nr:DUF349 domain-containing protein [Flavobacteriaceae bacterium]